MDSLSDDLENRITTRLHETGPTTVGGLASDLSEPFGSVLFALEKLRDGIEKHIKVLPGGLWAVTDEYKKQRVPDNGRPADCK
jgi:hypothetical protein